MPHNGTRFFEAGDALCGYWLLAGGGGLTWFKDAADENMSVFVWEEPLRFGGLGKFLVYKDYCYECLIQKFIYEISFSRFFLLLFIV